MQTVSCKTCTHWTELSADRYATTIEPTAPLGKCACPRMIQVNGKTNGWDDVDPDGLGIESYSFRGTPLDLDWFTGPEFGCVHWEKRDA